MKNTKHGAPISQADLNRMRGSVSDPLLRVVLERKARRPKRPGNLNHELGAELKALLNQISSPKRSRRIWISPHLAAFLATLPRPTGAIQK
jgi:hypothetical protein